MENSPCKYGTHERISDGLTIDGVALWHCARCGAGVRRAVIPNAVPPRHPWGFWLAIVLAVAVAIAVICLVRA